MTIAPHGKIDLHNNRKSPQTLSQLKLPTIAPHATVKTDVELFLANWYTKNHLAAESISPDYGRLWQVMLRNHGAGGKRFRPYILMLAYQGLGGENYEGVIPVAAALELLHTSLLVHDDIIDRDYVRHGKLNIAGNYQTIYTNTNSTVENEHYANSAALLGGDLILSGSYELILESTLSTEQKLLAAKHLAKIIFVVTGGELLDTESALQPIPDVDSIQIARLKTADYSFVGPLKLGAALVNADPVTQNKLQAFGEAIGVAYQLTDDLLGIFGNQAVTGKSTSSDLEEGKRTFLMQKAFSLASTTQQAELNRLIGQGKITPKDLNVIQSIILDTGARDQTEQLITKYAEDARNALSGLTISRDAHTSLLELVTNATKRQY